MCLLVQPRCTCHRVHQGASNQITACETRTWLSGRHHGLLDVAWHMHCALPVMPPRSSMPVACQWQQIRPTDIQPPVSTILKVAEEVVIGAHCHSLRKLPLLQTCSCWNTAAVLPIHGPQQHQDPHKAQLGVAAKPGVLQLPPAGAASEAPQGAPQGALQAARAGAAGGMLGGRSSNADLVDAYGFELANLTPQVGTTHP